MKSLSLRVKRLQTLDEREELIKKEKQSIDESREEFKKATEEFNKIKDRKLKEEADNLQSLMNSRYETHDTLYELYLQGLNQKQEKYMNLLKKKIYKWKTVPK